MKCETTIENFIVSKRIFRKYFLNISVICESQKLLENNLAKTFEFEMMK